MISNNNINKNNEHDFLERHERATGFFIYPPSRLSNRVSYHLMRQNRKPLWEDRENENGGIYTYRCPKDKTNTVWQELCLAAIGEQFSVIEGDDVVGVSVQSRDGLQDLVQIWNSNPSEQAQNLIDEKIRNLFPDINFTIKFYKANSSHANFEAEDGAQIQLVYNKSEHIPLKDFAAEIRGGKDIKEFILSALVLLDVQDTSIGDLLEIILRRIKQNNVPHNGGATTSPSLSVSSATTTMISNTVSSIASGHRENLNIEEIKQAIFVNDRVRILAKTLQATTATETNWTYDQSWLAIMCTSPSILKRHVAIARLKNPCNLGRNCQEARFIVFILSPMKEKGTKNFLETGRTFATIFADIELRAKLLKAATQQEFISIIDKHTDHLMEQQTAVTRSSLPDPFDDTNTNTEASKDKIYYFPIPSDICMDLSRRLPHYLSDYYDIFQTHHGPQKVLSTAVFLYFACLLPSIAFGVLNSQATNNQI
ncbi:unnamed protein product, partial [Rotaria sp. Silwood1]